MSGDTTKLWFVAHMEEGKPIEVLDWSTWTATGIHERNDNAVLVIAKDHMDAYLKATRGNFIR
jgi:hypothetical protein